MHLLYNIGIIFLGVGIRIGSLFNPKLKQWITGRRQLYSDAPDFSNREVIWFHCASLGEFDQGLPLINKIKENHPELFVLVTFFSPSGMNHYHKRDHKADYVAYIALDTPSNAKQFIDKFKPSKCFFIKYEFWGNHILVAKRSGAKLYNVSGIFRENHRFFKGYGAFFRTLLHQFNFFFLQTQKSKELLQSIGIHSMTVTGDSRFDKVLENKSNAVENALIEQFKGSEDLFIVGSSWSEDIALLQNWITSSSMKVLIAPHKVDEVTIAKLQGQFPSAVRYTEANPSTVGDAAILILDTIGQLSNAFQYGSMAYIGGGFSGNLHNILEPAAFGLPVLFGPKHDRFPEAELFIENGVGYSVATARELNTSIDAIVANYAEISEKINALVVENSGATARIYEHVFNAS